jgi:hypothetical protein
MSKVKPYFIRYDVEDESEELDDIEGSYLGPKGEAKS